ncbi:hypothetical protein D2A34_07080 [Clostridium chromiireducens]|uniref:Uncharacterized protein n=1 Tax=Clostridium chromiireducens TaxID=225345 RepID=A0A399IPM6_9CLOT|nr:hypothetical protein [Clostridium chromiireducens]RII34965.1 hypothetical protein D2A34_07080 [Clostridium chromiireducens]
MSDNRIISRSEYVVTSVSNAAIDNRIIKRPYSDSKNPPRKKRENSKSFNNSLNAAAKHLSSNDNSTTFYNELENMERLKSAENARIVQARFNKNNFNSHVSNNAAETEIHNKLSQAMDVEIDVSTLYKKVQLLSSLNDESEN